MVAAFVRDDPILTEYEYTRLVKFGSCFGNSTVFGSCFGNSTVFGSCFGNSRVFDTVLVTVRVEQHRAEFLTVLD